MGSNLPQRKIIHVDADCFYAAVEARDNPKYRGVPLVVGGSPDGRGVVATASYEARRFGVHSAMPSARALRLCPDLVFVKPDMARYKAASQGMHAVFNRYTSLIEPLSLDEAFLDVSDSPHEEGSATRIAQRIRDEIFEEVGIRVSAGVSVNKFLAKMASDWEKPNGLTVIGPSRVAEFVECLPLKKLPGVGPKTAEKLKHAGLETTADVRAIERSQLIKDWGAMGPRLYDLARGQDERAVKTERVGKSVSVEHTFDENLETLKDCHLALDSLRASLLTRLGDRRDRVQGIFVKLKFSDFTITTSDAPAASSWELGFNARLEAAFARSELPVRLMGVGVRLRPANAAEQLEFEEFKEKVEGK